MAKEKSELKNEVALDAKILETSPEVNQAISEADNEIVAAKQLADKVATDAGIKVKSAPAKSSERREIKNSEFIRVARRQREFGQKMLANKRAGYASVNKTVEFNNNVVASLFERFFPVVDQCLFLLKTQGEYRMGSAADRLSAAMLTRINELKNQTKSELNASSEIVSNVLANSNSVIPTYNDVAFSMDVQIKTPEALVFLEALHRIDKIVENAEVLRWNGERNNSDVQDVTHEFKRAINRLFEFCRNVLTRLSNDVDRKLLLQLSVNS